MAVRAVDPQLANAGSALRQAHRYDGDEERCAAGCDGPRPCRGQRLGSQVLLAASAPHHARLTVWRDLLSQGVFTPGGVLSHVR
ncbi:hypothetical protein AB0M46_21595 [Dactylosporangium sp. NPDC051485]|uniref:hypothetical protein n=1 Tax=Dactylosporangium sp. NPDC051485 TaxID=3154846 RepID=UPI0034232322